MGSPSSLLRSTSPLSLRMMRLYFGLLDDSSVAVIKSFINPLLPSTSTYVFA